MTNEETMLRNLLARIHRDGGHHTEKVGLDQSFKDADERVSELIADDRHAAYDEMIGALRVFLETSSVAPASCFNTSHDGTLEEDCDDCRKESAACRALEVARSRARAALGLP